MSTVPAGQVAQQVLNDGGDQEQSLVAAALVSGIESDGDPTELSGGVGPAAGLFQFEPGTWIGDGGGTYAPVAQDASWQDQVQVFLNATQGDNFHDWGPDLVANEGNPNSSSNPAYSYSGAPQAGSAVATKIAQLEAGGLPAGSSSATAPNATDASLNANPFDFFGIPSTIAGGAASATAGVVLPFLAKAVLVSAGLAVAVLGLYKLADPGGMKGIVSDVSPEGVSSGGGGAPSAPPAPIEAAAA